MDNLYVTSIITTVKFLGAHIDNHLNKKLHVEYMERAFLIGRMGITKLNSISATLLIRLYKTFARPYMNYA